MGSWVASVLGSCMFLPSLPLATGLRKSDLLSPVRSATFISDVPDLQLVHIYNKLQKKFLFYFIFCFVQESQHVVLDLGQLSSPQWWPNCWKCLTGSGPTGSSPDSASWYFLSFWQYLLSLCVLQLILISSSQCTFLGLTMKPVPKPKCDSIDSITEMKQKNGPIIKVCRIICHV